MLLDTQLSKESAGSLIITSYNILQKCMYVLLTAISKSGEQQVAELDIE